MRQMRSKKIAKAKQTPASGPKEVRQGSRIEFALVADHVEMRVKNPLSGGPGSGFGMLKSSRAAVPADFDPATLLKR